MAAPVYVARLGMLLCVLLDVRHIPHGTMAHTGAPRHAVTSCMTV